MCDTTDTCPTGYTITEKVSKGRTGSTFLAFCGGEEYVLKWVNEKEKELQEKANAMNVSVPIRDIIQCKGQFGILMEKMDSTLEENLYVPKVHLDYIIPYCEKILYDLCTAIQPFGKFESCKKIIARLHVYQSSVRDFKTIDQFYNMFFHIRYGQQFMKFIKKEAHILSRGNTLPLSYVQIDFDFYEEIYEEMKDADLTREDILTYLKIEDDEPRVKLPLLPELPLPCSTLIVSFTPEEKVHYIKIMAKCILLLKKLSVSGIVHNDLHAENIMKKGENYYLIDFGESFYEEDATYDMEDLLEIFYQEAKDYPLLFENEFIKTEFDSLQEKTMEELIEQYTGKRKHGKKRTHKKRTTYRKSKVRNFYTM